MRFALLRKNLSGMTMAVLTVMFTVLSSVDLWAQENRTVSGKVLGESSGEPLIGATINVKGTTQGTTTDVEGRYKLEVPADTEILVFSYMGYISSEIAIGNRATIDISLKEDREVLEEVVVTALGVERNVKALGYQVQEIEGSKLAEAKEGNIVNSLSGKIAGVNIANGVSGFGSTSRIIIRGENSLSGDNQPLFVVDGVPIKNSTDARNNSKVDASNMNVDFGNYAADLSPDDIESVSVLKGAAAAALYGSRAGNGVVLITTKKGNNGRKGIGVEYNASFTMETPLVSPDYQDKYGQGKNFSFEFYDGNGSGVADGVDESWGPLLDGRMIKQFDSPTAGGKRGADVHNLNRAITNESLSDRGAITATPWVAQEDNLEELYQTAFTMSNTISLSSNNEFGHFRTSIGNTYNQGLFENTDLNRNSFKLSGGYNLTEKLKVNANVNYIKTESDNRPVNGYGTESIMYLLIWYGRQVNTANLRDYWQKDLEGIQQFNYNYNYHDNPFFTLHENTNGVVKNRLIGNVSMTYKFNDQISLMARAGTDYVGENRTWRRAFSTQRFKEGQFRQDLLTFQENNFDFLLNYDSDQQADFAYNLSFGGNLMTQRDDYNAASANKLVVPGVYNLGNSAIPVVNYQERKEREIQSLYGMARLAYKNVLFADITGRNDWSSTLPSANRSYFYPSVALSGIVSDMVKLPEFVSFAKIRASWAQVGNDTDPYNLLNYYSFGQPFLGNPTASEDNAVANDELKPEIATSTEFGADLRFFNGRLGIDFTYYINNSENQIIRVETPQSSGYTGRWINAGEIESKGLELVLSGTPVKTKNFRWDINLNWSRDRSKVIELAEGLKNYTIASNSVQVLAKEGGRMGDIYGTGFAKTPAGEVIYDNDGNPVVSNELRNLGNYNPDWMAGINNSLSYKNLNLSFLFDIRQGGVILSRTKLIASTSGNLEETLVGRDKESGGLQWTDGSGNVRHDGIIGKGVVNVGTDEAPNYVENTTIVAASQYYNKHFKRQHEEQGMYDASYVKLREVKLSYRLPSKLLSKTPFQSATFSLVGRNLLLWTDNPHFDPEAISFGGSRIVPGVENANMPSLRSYGFNLNIKL
ncbi:SusC/RagA family TonB-linked outer membrane protein (plasmid) [Fulvitalea axinellae]|uniref:SusC/RagA family TonB-linked outer membrane protein n=1 Tax=Fulvitalea axinellae TaxID=1182444 RepID=A0AAU9CW24_9BACT|nr:SusC/RagA family TonB-linked outer membrane protein [Fulvitalea axinellae]